MRFLIAIVTGVACASCASAGARLTISAPVVTPDGVRFVMRRPEAQSVAVAGTFNGWSASAHPLERTSASGIWSRTVALPPGEHLFMYVVNGAEWISPPLADDYADDGFGAKNGVVIVRPTE